MRTLLLGLLLGFVAPALAVTTCGETVPAGSTGVLMNDLVCAGPAGVYVDSHGTLDMNGYTITVTDPAAIGVYCLFRTCAVVSNVATPGEISGTAADQWGIYAFVGAYPGPPFGRVRRLEVENVFIHDVQYGIRADETAVFATNVTASNCQIAGIHAKRLRLETVTANDNGLDGFSFRTGLRGTNVTTNNNTYGMRNASGNVRLIGYNSTGNEYGIAVSFLRVENSDVRGNTNWDIGTPRRPVLINTLCDNSRNLAGGVPPGTTWGVCALD